MQPSQVGLAPSLSAFQVQGGQQERSATLAAVAEARVLILRLGPLQLVVAAVAVAAVQVRHCASAAQVSDGLALLALEAALH